MTTTITRMGLCPLTCNTRRRKAGNHDMLYYTPQAEIFTMRHENSTTKKKNMYSTKDTNNTRQLYSIIM